MKSFKRILSGLLALTTAATMLTGIAGAVSDAPEITDVPEAPDAPAAPETPETTETAEEDAPGAPETDTNTDDNAGGYYEGWDAGLVFDVSTGHITTKDMEVIESLEYTINGGEEHYPLYSDGADYFDFTATAIREMIEAPQDNPFYGKEGKKAVINVYAYMYDETDEDDGVIYSMPLTFEFYAGKINTALSAPTISGYEVGFEGTETDITFSTTAPNTIGYILRYVYHDTGTGETNYESVYLDESKYNIYIDSEIEYNTPIQVCSVQSNGYISPLTQETLPKRIKLPTWKSNIKFNMDTFTVSWSKAPFTIGYDEAIDYVGYHSETDYLRPYVDYYVFINDSFEVCLTENFLNKNPDEFSMELLDIFLNEKKAGRLPDEFDIRIYAGRPSYKKDGYECITYMGSDTVHVKLPANFGKVNSSIPKPALTATLYEYELGNECTYTGYVDLSVSNFSDDIYGWNYMLTYKGGKEDEWGTTVCSESYSQEIGDHGYNIDDRPVSVRARFIDKNGNYSNWITKNITLKSCGKQPKTIEWNGDIKIDEYDEFSFAPAPGTSDDIQYKITIKSEGYYDNTKWIKNYNGDDRVTYKDFLLELAYEKATVPFYGGSDLKIYLSGKKDDSHFVDDDYNSTTFLNYKFTGGKINNKIPAPVVQDAYITDNEYEEPFYAIYMKPQSGIKGYVVKYLTKDGIYIYLTSSLSLIPIYMDVEEEPIFALAVYPIDSNYNLGPRSAIVSSFTDKRESLEPVPPSNVKATAGDKQVTLTWNAVSGATKYGVSRYENNKYIEVNYNVTGTSYTVKNLTNGTTYKFLVQAYVGGKWSPIKTDYLVSATPKSAASNNPVVKATAGDKQVTLSWAKIDGATKYGVSRYVNGKYVEESYNVTGTSYTVKNLTNGTKYQFLVQSYVKGTWSTISTTLLVSATPNASINPAVTATAGDKQVTLKWNAIEGATKYAVSRYENKKYIEVNYNVTDTSYTVKNLTNGTEYKFLVQAYVNGKWSPISTTLLVSATPKAAASNDPVVKATAGDKQVTLSWAKIDGATKYGVSRYVNGKYVEESYNVTGTSYTVKNLTNGTKYQFLVQSYVKGTWSTISTTLLVSATPKASSNIPTITEVTPGDTTVYIKWEAVNGATKYAVSSYENGKYNVINSELTGTKSTISGLTNGKTYKFLVQSYVNGKWSSISTTLLVSATPFSPIPVVTVTAGSKQVTLKWKAIAGATKYGVSRYTGDKYVEESYNVTGTSYTIKNLTNGTKYQFLVQAYVNNKWSSSDKKYLVSAIPKPATVPTVTATAGDGQVTLSWNKISGATKYAVSHYKNGKFVEVNYNVTANSYTVKDLTNGTTYSFHVQAYVNGNWSPANVNYCVNAKPYSTVPVVTVTAGNKQVKLTWQAVAGATKYALSSYENGKYNEINYNITDTSGIIPNLTNGKTYKFLVQAYVNGTWSSSDTKYIVSATPKA